MDNNFEASIYNDYPIFTPNITPYSVMKEGAFGGTYFRPITSSVTGKRHSKVHLKYDWGDLNLDRMTKPCEAYDPNDNKYGVTVGVDIKNECGLNYWESKGWIRKEHPYGWFNWWCDVHNNKRFSKEYDEYQIRRWLSSVGPKGRFRIWVYNRMKEEGGYGLHNRNIRKLAQICHHWGYKINKSDYNLQHSNRR